jgi:hypothetical protein
MDRQAALVAAYFAGVAVAVGCALRGWSPFWGFVAGLVVTLGAAAVLSGLAEPGPDDDPEPQSRRTRA